MLWIGVNLLQYMEPKIEYQSDLDLDMEFRLCLVALTSYRKPAVIYCVLTGDNGGNVLAKTLE